MQSDCDIFILSHYLNSLCLNSWSSQNRNKPKFTSHLLCLSFHLFNQLLLMAYMLTIPKYHPYWFAKSSLNVRDYNGHNAWGVNRSEKYLSPNQFIIHLASGCDGLKFLYHETNCLTLQFFLLSCSTIEIFDGKS